MTKTEYTHAHRGLSALMGKDLNATYLPAGYSAGAGLILVGISASAPNVLAQLLVIAACGCLGFTVVQLTLVNKGLRAAYKLLCDTYTTHPFAGDNVLQQRLTLYPTFKGQLDFGSLLEPQPQNILWDIADGQFFLKVLTPGQKEKFLEVYKIRSLRFLPEITCVDTSGNAWPAKMLVIGATKYYHIKDYTGTKED